MIEYLYFYHYLVHWSMNQWDIHLELRNKNLNGKSHEGWKFLRKIPTSPRSMHLALPITDSSANEISEKLDADTSKHTYL